MGNCLGKDNADSVNRNTIASMPPPAAIDPEEEMKNKNTSLIQSSIDALQANILKIVQIKEGLDKEATRADELKTTFKGEAKDLLRKGRENKEMIKEKLRRSKLNEDKVTTLYKYVARYDEMITTQEQKVLQLQALDAMQVTAELLERYQVNTDEIEDLNDRLKDAEDDINEREKVLVETDENVDVEQLDLEISVIDDLFTEVKDSLPNTIKGDFAKELKKQYSILLDEQLSDEKWTFSVSYMMSELKKLVEGENNSLIVIIRNELKSLCDFIEEKEMKEFVQEKLITFFREWMKGFLSIFEKRIEKDLNEVANELVKKEGESVVKCKSKQEIEAVHDGIVKEYINTGRKNYEKIWKECVNADRVTSNYDNLLLVVIDETQKRVLGDWNKKLNTAKEERKEEEERRKKEEEEKKKKEEEEKKKKEEEEKRKKEEEEKRKKEEERRKKEEEKQEGKAVLELECE